MTGKNLLVVDNEIEEFSKNKNLKGTMNKIAIFVAVLMSIFHIYTAFFGIFTAILQRSTHLAFALVLIFIVTKSTKKGTVDRIPWYDYLFILLSVFSLGYLVINADEISSRYAFVEPLSSLQMIVGVIALLLIIEATRRTVGWALAIIVIFFLAYGLWGHHLPGAIGHREFSFEWIIEQLFYTTSGVFGTPLGISATFVFMFILFGKFLEGSGAGQFFIDLAVGGMGKYRGGPAKTAVVASGILGTISGSAVANTVTTGSFTIPLMKKTGYKGSFAGAVESAASTGGQIVPPIMGAAAFMIAAYLGMPYAEVAIAAIIPAFLYYVCLIFQVDFRASRLGLKGLPKNELPNIKNVLKEGFLFVLPLALIIYLLFAGYSPFRAGLFGIITVLVVTVLKRKTRLNLKKIIDILHGGARGALETAIACASAGIIMGIISQTGIGLRFSSFIIELAGGSLLLTLIFTMIVSMILGMGLPTVAAYIVQVGLTIPALIDLGVMPLAAHLFVFYYACISAITPPVALAAYAAAGIAGSDPMRTGFIALRLGIGALLVPYMFVYGPSLLLIGDSVHIILSIITAIVGVYGLAAGVEGWMVNHMKWWERFGMILCAVLLVYPGLVTDAFGLIGMVIIFLVHRFLNNRIQPSDLKA